jgi:competence protein ComEC
LPAGLADRAAWLRRLLSKWVPAEIEPGRLIPWMAVAFGFGIVVYFTAVREPAWWAASALALVGVAVAILARRRPVGFPLALGFAGIAAGFATATLRTAYVVHPVLQFPVSTVTLSGFVEIREERERSDRITVRVHTIEGRRLNEAPERFGSRCAKTPRPRSAASSSSRRTCRRRSRPCAPAATTSRAICISIASALPATRLEKSRSRRRRSMVVFGWGTRR